MACLQFPPPRRAGGVPRRARGAGALVPRSPLKRRRERWPSTRGPMGVKSAAQSPARRLGTASLWLPPVPGDKVLRGASQSTLILPARRPVWTSGHLPQRLSSGTRNPDTQAILAPGTRGCPAVGTWSFEAASGGRRWVCGRLRNPGGLTGRQHGVLCSRDPDTQNCECVREGSIGGHSVRSL